MAWPLVMTRTSHHVVTGGCAILLRVLARSVQRFTDLMVWQRSHALTLEIYRLTGSFPLDERYGLVSQLRRAAASVPTNIAEGSRRQRSPDYARFLNIAEGSLAEVEYLLMLSRDLKLVPVEAVAPLLHESSEIFGMLHTLRQRVEDSR